MGGADQMALVERNRQPSAQDLRVFGLIIAIFFGILGAIFHWKLHWPRVAMVLWTLGLLVPMIYYAVPALRWPLYMAWMAAVYPVGWLVSHLLFAVVFYGAVTPVGLLTRLFGRDPMHRRFDLQKSTYWTTLDLDTRLSSYFKQY
jgi:hypothetical protein